jgi:hypothetical protein
MTGAILGTAPLGAMPLASYPAMIVVTDAWLAEGPSAITVGASNSLIVEAPPSMTVKASTVMVVPADDRVRVTR